MALRHQLRPAQRPCAQRRQLSVLCKAAPALPSPARVASSCVAAAVCATVLLTTPPAALALKSACGYDPTANDETYLIQAYQQNNTQAQETATIASISDTDVPHGSIHMSHAPDLNGLGLPDSLSALFMSVGGEVEVGPAEITPAVAEWVEVADAETFEELAQVFPVQPGMSPGESLALKTGFPMDEFEELDVCNLRPC